MAIIRKINGKMELLANVSITSHDQLDGREAYGCHPISAIRKLPEKLHSLKEVDDRLLETVELTKTNLESSINDSQNLVLSMLDSKANEIYGRIDLDYNNNLNEHATLFGYIDNVSNNLRNSINNISLIEDSVNPGYLLYTDSNGNMYNLRTGYMPDNNTIQLTPDNRLIGRAITNSDGLFFDAYDLNTMRNNIFDIQNKDIVQDNKLFSLETITKGMGGYLNSYDFGTATPTQDQLTQYALQDVGVNNAGELYNGTKLINLFNHDVWMLANHYSDIALINSIINAKDITYFTIDIPLFLDWLNRNNYTRNANDEYIIECNADGSMTIIGPSFSHGCDLAYEIGFAYNGTFAPGDTLRFMVGTKETFDWTNLGPIQNISVATDHSFGLVKSSMEDLAGSIDLNGTITINNLQTKLSGISSRIDGNDATLNAHMQTLNNLAYQDQLLSSNIQNHSVHLIDLDREIDSITTTIANLDGDYATDAQLEELAARMALATKIIRLNEV